LTTALVPAWMRGYRREWLRFDLIAGVVIWSLVTPRPSPTPRSSRSCVAPACSNASRSRRPATGDRRARRDRRYRASIAIVTSDPAGSSVPEDGSWAETLHNVASIVHRKLFLLTATA
jgi:hypothetical protein